MPLFRRRKEEPQDEPFMQTKKGWQRLREVLAEDWDFLAANAWTSYQERGRGAVLLDDDAGGFMYVTPDQPDWSFYTHDHGPASQALREHIRRYNPKKEIVLVTRVAYGADRRIASFAEIVRPHLGVLSPPKAADMVARTRYDSVRKHIGKDATDEESRAALMAASEEYLRAKRGGGEGR